MNIKLITKDNLERFLTWIDVALSAIQTRINSLLPSKTGNAGKVLAVNSNEDGMEWVSLSGSGGDSLPSQTGHNGEYLMTNGSSASWNAVCLINLYN